MTTALSRLVLFRHGMTTANQSGRFQGWSDAALAPRGRRTVETAVRRLVAFLGSRGVAVIVSSDLLRARQTAALLPAAPIVREPRLRELDFGEFEGRTPHDLLEEEDVVYRAWLDDPDRNPPPAGEPLSVLRDRVVDWWDEPNAQTLEHLVVSGRGSTGAVVVVTHGGPIGVLLNHVLAAEDPSRNAVPMPGGYVILRPDSATSDPEPFANSAGWQVETSHRCFVREVPATRGRDAR